MILDVWLRDSQLDGLGILNVLHAEEPSIPVIMISGHGTIETAVAALQHGAYDFIEKPFQADRLLVVVRRALEASRLARENEELRLRAGQDTELFGNSALITAVRGQIERVAPTGSRVLITGGPGAGKEVAARMIHARSRRADGPFVALNCAILAPNRFEEELFGLEGAADGTGRRTGVLERAHGGTLVLDEVADMPLETQGKIVRALQDQTFERLGGSDPGKSGYPGAGHHKPGLAGRDYGRALPGRSVLSAGRCALRLPGLRERRDDIPGLAELFLRRAAEMAGLPQRELSADAIAALQAYDWPGNARELRNLMERVLIMMPGNSMEPIRAEMLPSTLGEGAPALLKFDASADVMSLPLRDARDMFETQYLQAQLLRFGGNISRTAIFVGMERSALHRKLKQLGVTSEERGVG